MRSLRIFSTLALVASLVAPGLASAAVSVPTGPTSLVTSPTSFDSSSGPLAVFSLSLGQTAGETLSSVAVTINNNGSSTASGTDFSSVAVYKDNGDGTFSAATDLLAGSQTTVNVGSPTLVSTGANNAIDGGKFFVTISTGASWSSASAPADSITVTFAADGIITSANSPTVTAVTTSAITADTVGPQLTSAVAMNTGGTSAKEAGDSIQFTFNEPTTKPVISVGNLPTTLSLSGGHSFLDGLGVLMSASWNAAGTVYTLTLSGNGTLPSVEPGDTVTAVGSLIQDSLGNSAGGSQVISGSFTSDVTAPQLTGAVAFNTGGTAAKEAGDSVQLTFNEATNKPALVASQVASSFTLNNSHSWLDGAGAVGSASWNAAGTMLTITLSAGTSVPTVAVGDMVTMAGSLVQDTSGNAAAGSPTITGSFGVADTTGPVLMSALAQNTGGTSAKEAGDSVVLTFGEATNKPTISDSNVVSTLSLNNGHSWFDGAGHIASAAWDVGGTMLTVTLSAGTSVPTVAVGDTVTIAGSVITDAAGNAATGSRVISGSFGGAPTTGGGKVCPNGLLNGRLYQVSGQNTVYLAAACRLKVFKGKALEHARGKKFKNIITIQSLDGLTTLPKPVKHDDNDKNEQEQGNGKKLETPAAASTHPTGKPGKSEAKGRGHSED